MRFFLYIAIILNCINLMAVTESEKATLKKVKDGDEKVSEWIKEVPFPPSDKCKLIKKLPSKDQAELVGFSACEENRCVSSDSSGPSSSPSPSPNGQIESKVENRAEHQKILKSLSGAISIGSTFCNNYNLGILLEYDSQDFWGVQGKWKISRSFSVLFVIFNDCAVQVGILYHINHSCGFLFSFSNQRKSISISLVYDIPISHSVGLSLLGSANF